MCYFFETTASACGQEGKTWAGCGAPLCLPLCLTPCVDPLCLLAGVYDSCTATNPMYANLLKCSHHRYKCATETECLNACTTPRASLPASL